jgi:hypothetical protein
MHRTIAEQGLYLRRVLNGFFNYFAVPTNSRAINSFYYNVGWHSRVRPGARAVKGAVGERQGDYLPYPRPRCKKRPLHPAFRWIK